MASIKEVRKNVFKITVYAGRDINNKQLFEYDTVEGKRAALARAREMEEDIANNGFSNVKNMKFADYAEKWLKLIEPEIKPSTMVSYRMYTETHFNAVFGKKKLCDIEELSIKQYLSDKLKTNSPNTVRKQFFVLRRMLHDALKRKSPCADIKPPKAQEYKAIVVSEKDFNLIHAAVKNQPDEIFVLLAGWCGMRLGEILVLKWNDINFKFGTIRVDEALTLSDGDDVGYEEDVPKSQRGIREIIADEYVLDLLSKMKKEYLKDDSKEEDVADFKIFDIRPDSYSKRFAKIIKLHNDNLVSQKPTKCHKRSSIKEHINYQDTPLPKIRFHDLRHYHASILYTNKISDQYAAERLGHDITVLKKIYQGLQENMRKEEDNKVKNMNKKKA